MIRLILILIVVTIVAGAVFLVMRDIPAPTRPVEKVISNDRFAR